MITEEEVEIVNRRIGKINISAVLVKTSHLTVLELFDNIKFLPFKVDYDYLKDEFIYTGICNQFREVPMGEVIPSYAVTMTKTTLEEIKQ